MSKQTVVLTPAETVEVKRSRARAVRLVRAQLKSMTDEEDARLTAAAENDPDNPPLTEEDWKRMRPADDVHPHLVRKSLLRRGRPKLAAPKQQITLRLDREVLDHFRKGGSGWQTVINDTLRKAISRRKQAAPRAAKRKSPARASKSR